MGMPTAVETSGLARDAMVPAPFAVTAARRDTEDTVTVDLVAHGGGALAFAPGQFTMLSAGGHGEVPISISGDPDRPGVLRHTVRAVGLATAAITRAAPGDVLGVRGPFGRGWPVAELEGRDVVVAAGGIGLAPLRPAILHLLARRERYGRIVLLYGGRTPAALLYGDELEDWRRRGLEVALTVDAAEPGWHGAVGVVTRLVDRAQVHHRHAGALVCGPEIMMRLVASALLERGLAGERLHVSLERNMQCGIARCGHCQLGPVLLCRDGPVVRWSDVAPWLRVREL